MITWSIKLKFCISDCVHETTEYAENGWNLFLRKAVPKINEIYTFWDNILDLSLPYFFSPEHSHRPHRACQLICARSGSNDEVWRKEMPLDGGIAIKSRLGVQNPR